MGSSDQLLSDRRNGARFRKRYELFKEDVAHLKERGLKGYRFSIDWSRVLPDGFGIIYVDFETQERIWKDSAYWSRELISRNGNDL